MRIWYNHGYSQTRDAFVLLRQAEGCRNTLIATSANAAAPVFMVANEHGVEPDFDRSTAGGRRAYGDWCRDFARDNAVDVFVVQRGRSEMARRRGEFEALGVVLVVAATGDMLDQIEDKTCFYRLCQAAGLPTPVFREVRSLAAFDDAVGHIRAQGLAACIKPPQGVFGAGYWQLDDETPLFDQLMRPDDRRLGTAVVRDAICQMAALHPPSAMPPLLVMQHLPGSEWSVDCVCDNGTIVAGVTRQKIGTHQIVEADAGIMALAGRLARRFGFSNLVNIQFKAADADNSRPHVLEINPRMSGGCFYADLAGINLPHIQLQVATGRFDRANAPKPKRVVVTAVNAAMAIDMAAAPVGQREAADA